MHSSRGFQNGRRRRATDLHSQTLVATSVSEWSIVHSSTFVGLREDVSGLEVNPLGISTLAMEKLRIAKRVQEREPRQTGL